MRISATKVVQLIESEPPKIVILDQDTGEEVVLDETESFNLVYAVKYFFKGLDIKLPS